MEQIVINKLACKYSMSIPENWDTIPRKVISDKMGREYDFDIALYPRTSNEYFHDYYVLVSFLPTNNSLNTFTFDAICSQVQQSNGQAQKTIGDSIKLNNVHTSTKVSKGKYNILTEIKATKNSSDYMCLRDQYLTKYGFISINCYKKTDCKIKLTEVDSLITSHLIVQDEYEYSEPSSSSVFSISNIIISLMVGGILYLIMSLFEKKGKK